MTDGCRDPVGCARDAGHTCWGILNAPATGLSLAELIVDEGGDPAKPDKVRERT